MDDNFMKLMIAIIREEINSNATDEVSKQNLGMFNRMADRLMECNLGSFDMFSETSKNELADILTQDMSGIGCSKLRTINTNTGDYVEVDYQTGTETILTKASDIFCYRFTKTGAKIIHKDQAKGLESMINPKIVFASESDENFRIITPEVGNSVSLVRKHIIPDKTRIFGFVESSSGSNYCTIGEKYVYFGGPPKPIEQDHNIPNIWEYSLLSGLNFIALYKNNTVTYIRRGEDPEVVYMQPEVYGNLKIFENTNLELPSFCVDARTEECFHVSRFNELRKNLKDMQDFVLNESIIKIYLKDNKLFLMSAIGTWDYVDNFSNDVYLPLPKARRAKSARKTVPS